MSKGRIARNDTYGKKEYIGKVPLHSMKKIMRYRTFMNVIPGNYKAKTEGRCILWHEAKGTAEHYFGCSETQHLADIWDVDAQDLQSNDVDKMKDVATFLKKVEFLIAPLYKNM